MCLCAVKFNVKFSPPILFDLCSTFSTAPPSFKGNFNDPKTHISIVPIMSDSLTRGTTSTIQMFFIIIMLIIIINNAKSTHYPCLFTCIDCFQMSLCVLLMRNNEGVILETISEKLSHRRHCSCASRSTKDVISCWRDSAVCTVTVVHV